jgi:predicted metal-dependent enzyme (double-stranded beta helix superfamily)
MSATAASRPVTLDGDLDPSRFAHLRPAPTATAPTVADLVHRAREIAADPARWRHLVRYDDRNRWRLRLHHEAGYEVWLMSWLPGQRTGPHDHGDTAAVIAVVQGELQEHTRQPGTEQPRIHRIGAEHVRIWGARHVREIVNAAAAPAVSVHIHAPPLPDED